MQNTCGFKKKNGAVALRRRIKHVIHKATRVK